MVVGCSCCRLIGPVVFVSSILAALGLLISWDFTLPRVAETRRGEPSSGALQTPKASNGLSLAPLSS